MREQIQRLNKTPGTEVSQGVLSSGVTQTPSMPFVQQQKTKGQRLAETFGVFTEGVTKITGAVVQDINAKEQAYQAIEGNADGVKYSQEVIDQARELPLEQQSAFIRNRMETRLDEMRKIDVSQSYLKSYMSSFMNGAGNFDADVNKQVWQNKKAETLTKTVSLVQQSRLAGESHSQIMNNIMNANDIDRATAGELYTNSMAMFIKEQAQNDPSYDWQGAIDTHLKVTSEDGAVNYATHPTYGKIIDNLESSLTTLKEARTTAADKAKKAKSLELTNKMVSMSFNADTTAEDLAQAKIDLINNPQMFTSATQYKTALDAVDDALDNKGYSATNNTELKVGLKSMATLGLVDFEQLRLNKNNLTKEEYNEVANAIITYQSSVKGTTDEIVAKGISNLRYNGGKLVAPMFDLDGSGAENINQFYTEFDTWLASYVQENEGKRPSMKEATEKQKEIIDTIMKPTSSAFSFNTEDTKVTKGIQTVEDIIKTGDVGMLIEAAQNKIIEVNNNQPAKDLILNKGSMQEISDALDAGIISEEEVTNAYGPQTSTAPIGLGTQLQANTSGFEVDPVALENIQQEAKTLLGEKGWNEFKDAITLSEQLSGNFSDTLPESVTGLRSVRNNNLGNIKHNKKNNWKGQTSTKQDDTFVSFETPEMGVRALVKVVKSNLNATETIEEYVNRYASEPNEKAYYKKNKKLTKKLQNYANILADSQGVKDIKAPLNNNIDMEAWIKATAIAEGNSDALLYYTDEVINKGIELAQ